MLNWFTYLGEFIAKTYLGALSLIIVAAPSLHIATTKTIPTWTEYISSFANLIKRCDADTKYIWPLVILSCPIGFLVSEIIFRFNKAVGLHANLSIYQCDNDPDTLHTQKEYFHTTIFIQNQTSIQRIYQWESFQFNLFLCMEFAFEFFLAFNLLAFFVIGITHKFSPDSGTTVSPMIQGPALLSAAFVMYMVARRARESKFNAFCSVYKAICELYEKDRKQQQQQQQQQKKKKKKRSTHKS